MMMWYSLRRSRYRTGWTSARIRSCTIFYYQTIIITCFLFYQQNQEREKEEERGKEKEKEKGKEKEKEKEKVMAGVGSQKTFLATSFKLFKFLKEILFLYQHEVALEKNKDKGEGNHYQRKK